jgi:hypothetical protein
MGLPWFAEHLRALSGEASASLAVAPLRRTASALDELLVSGFTVWGAAGLLYVWLLALRDDWRSYPGRLVLPVFATVWLGFFLGFSIGWSRYAIPAVATSSLFTAKLLHDLAARWTPVAGARAANLGAYARRAIGNPLGTALLVLLASSVLSGLVSNAFAIQRARDTSPQDFAALVAQSVRPGAVIESCEWEIDFLTEQSYHHPSAHVIIQSIGTVFLGRSSQVVAEYRPLSTAGYLVNGPFSKLTGLYREEIRTGSFRLVASSGEYDLLRRDGL